jgi:DNA-binding NarL/FixJ family response regulator
MINYAIVEDDAEIRSNLQEILNTHPRYRCMISVGGVEQLLRRLNQNNLPDVIIMDINLPGMSGIDGTRLIKERYEGVEVMMLTAYDDANRVFESLRAGASGYLLKSSGFKELHEAIEMILSGGAPMTPQIARKTLQFFRPQKKVPKKSPLSEKEKEVVQGLVDGLSYKQIADRLYLSIGTIYTHIRNIYRKLHVNSKAEVVVKSLRGEI